jgi:signal transduction histidine kinase/ActR/RegA family two-component response regulator
MIRDKRGDERLTTVYELDIVTKDGRRVPIEVSTRLMMRDGQAIGVQGIARDITDRKRAERERAELLGREQAARAEAERASRTKDEFLSVLSHELRTPLTPILAWARMLQRTPLPPDVTTRGLQAIERGARSQAQLVDDLLDVSRIISGKLRLEVRPVELTSVIESAAESVRPAAEAKGIALEADLDAHAGPVAGDPERLQQVVWNLLSNAVKFTPEGGHVGITLTRDGGQVVVTVRDDGKGINAEFLPFLFERFRQADSSSTRAHGGLGLGLAIVRHLVELHGGAVRAESAGEGRGARFVVTLPALASLPEAALAVDEEREPLEPPALDGLRVLVVDDEPDGRELVTTLLESSGAQVQTAASVSEALAVLERSPVDLLVSDIGMPEEDGYALIRAVRARERGNTNLPAVALTAYAREEERTKALEAGFQVHVAKPFDPPELLSRIADLARPLRAASLRKSAG